MLLLCGNPNVGKSTVFNLLTGGDAHIANYPGVTVEVKHGHFTVNGVRWIVHDIPGIYSLSAQTQDEVVAETILLAERPQICLQVIDTQNLPKDLYLTVELLELGYRPVLLLNKWDQAERQGVAPEVEKLEQALGLTCIRLTAVQPGAARKLREFLAAVDCEAHARQDEPAAELDYGPVLEPCIEEIERILQASITSPSFSLRYAAVRMLTCGRAMGHGSGTGHGRGRGRGRGRWWRSRFGPPGECSEAPGTGWRRELRLRARDVCLRELGEEPAVVIARRRHEFIRRLLLDVGYPLERARQAPDAAGVRLPCEECPRGDTTSDRIDRWLLHPIWGTLAFLAGLWLIFQATFKQGSPLAALLDAGVAWLARSATAALSAWPFLASLIGEGIIPGVGLVAVFLPNILILFFALALLEDSGYLARGVLLTDGVMRRCGLSGRAFIPMMIAFGCNVPAILATRTMRSFGDRLVAIMVLPLLSCGARLPVYVLLVGAFFPAAWGGSIFLGLYLLGVLVAVLLANLLRRTAVRREPGALIFELPDYKRPRLRLALKNMWDNGKHYLQKAGTVILAAAVIAWFLFSFPQAPPAVAGAAGGAAGMAGTISPEGAPQPGALEQAQVFHSFAGRLGRALEPVFRPLGFDWRVVVGLLGATLAKEIMLSTMGVVYGASEEAALESPTLVQMVRVSSGLSPLTALALMVFVLLYMPCLPTLAVMSRELGSVRLTAAAVALHFSVAYLLALMIVSAGRALGIH